MQNFDDLDIEGRNPSHLSEEEREKEESDRKRLMRCSVTAEDGTLRPVYSRTEDGDIWCHICNIALFGSHKLQSHNTSSRHKIKLDEWPYPVSLWSKRDTMKGSMQSISSLNDSLAPGEPVPPGMEDQITRATQIQTSLDRHQSSPLVGLEYLLELIDNDSCEPSYTCVLCDKRGDPRTVMAHITSYNHRITYLNRHFPTISRAITDLPRTPNYKRGANEISVLVAKKIEEKFGRLHPQLVDKNQFEKNKLQFIKNVYQDYHFRETPELTFMEVYDVRWVTNFEEKLAEMTGESKKDENIDEKPKKEDSMEKAFPKKIEPDTSKSGMKIRIMTKEKLSKKADKEMKGPADDTKSLSSLSSISSSPSPSRSRSRSHSPIRTREKSSKHRLSNKSSRYGRSRSRSRSNEPLRERDKWDKFREQIRRAEETLDRALKFHEKNPEKHPAYPDEWKKFWNRRYKELQAEGKDPSKHDFKPEWIEFWNKRMREIHNEQLSQRKEEIRKRLELPEDKPPETKWVPPPKRDKEERSSPSKRSRHHVESDDDVEYVGTKMIKPERSEYRERHEREIVRDREYGYLYREKPSYRSYYVPSVRPPMPRPRHYTPYTVKEKSPSPAKDDNLKEDLEIVGLLRLLTALEAQLGSLGPKVVSLLSKALAAEKAKPNSAEELLYDEEVSVLFETVKEKLKGQLFAGMIEKVAIAATKSAIQNIAQLLHKATEEKKKREEEEEKKKKQAQEIARSIAAFSSRSLFPTIRSEPVSVPGIGAIDKVAIAQQIAAALIAQGRTNVSQDELETLINAVVGMAEASQHSDKPVTAASFVKSLTIKTQPTITEVITPVTTSSISTTPSIPEPPVVERVKETPIIPPKIIDPIEAHAARMEKLTDNDLKDLLQNFKELGTDEQHGLINFLKKLEASDPARVEKLRGYVNLGGSSSQRAETPVKDVEEIPVKPSRSVSPFASRKGAHNPIDDDHQKWKPKLDIFADEEEDKKRKEDERNKKIDLSDDDDDYSFEDIYKAADKNVSENEKARRSNSLSRSWSRSRSKSPLSKKEAKVNDPTAILNETKRLIANIMGDLPNKYVVKSHNPQKERQNSLNVDLAPPGSTNVSIPPSTNYPTSYPHVNQQNPISYPSNLSNQNFSNYQQPPQQSFNHQGYMNNMPSNMNNMPSSMSSMNPNVGSMSNMNNGYNNYNQPPYNNLNNQNQYGGPGMQQNQYPSQQVYGGPQYGAPSAPIGYPQQSQYGNYSQRFY
ncbi:uncharacterized protein CG7065-like isoform X1 [Chelonus insularis]|uniref:uncharacterized protein CG7065-like isoform X1 n=1 Tax=Chelonus insularis TaxID=460826 RepID=UPI00158C8778|nr:uncharacterized protein CG7065-like isoform X1 [Chelonus insularis]XP_034947075.1 uncharacterized protein CG7065-like isoform X1 [Chelonus insularis]